MTDQNEILIEKYLAGDLTPQEEKIFNELIANPEFAEEVIFFRQIKATAIAEGREQLKKTIQALANERSMKQKPLIINLSIRQIVYPLAASLVLLFAVSILQINSTAYNKYSKFSKRASYSNKIGLHTAKLGKG